jgi:hypothetical protein
VVDLQCAEMVDTNIPTNESLEDLLQLFESDSDIPNLTEVPLLSEAGFSYIYCHGRFIPITLLGEISTQ